LISSPESLHVLRITVAPELEELLDTVLSLLEVATSRWQPADGGAPRFDVFSELADEAVNLHTVLKTHLEAFAGDHHWHIESTQIRNENWQESWKAFFHVERVSRRIVTRPFWEAYTPGPGDCVVDIDPGMSFGTGQHATTKGCLRFLDALEPSLESPSLLDLGCGSGILSIAAAKLGYGPVLAIDFDPDAVRIAADNFKSNQVPGQVESLVADVSAWDPPHPYTVVAANILAPVLLANAERIAAAVSHPGGYLLLSGILTEQYAGIRERYTALGFKEVDCITEAEWTSGCFQVS